ncbi:hypothetical protein BGZ76_010358 [Entomortierella beljakovae]|nr:hypothetical protein BGZ76_010358 [Entomortierella beljakovae]
MTLQVVRPLGHVEHTFVAASNKLKIASLSVGNKIQYRSLSNNNIKDSAKISSWKTSKEWAQLFLDPLTWLLYELPNLSVIIDDLYSLHSNFLRLESIDTEKLIKVAPIKTSSDIAAQLEIQVNIPFDLTDQSTPLWRLLICPIEDEPSSFYLHYVLHHSLGDGVSCIVMMEQLIERLNVQAKSISSLSALDSRRSTIIPITTRKGLPPPFELLQDCKPSILKIIKIAGWVLLPYFLKPKYWTGDVDVLDDFRNVPRFELLEFTKEETTQLVRAAKRNSVTVHCLFQPTILFALKSVFLPNSDQGVNIGSPVNLRELISNPIPRTDQGNFTNIIENFNVRVKDENEFWEMTRVYSKEIQQMKSPAGVQNMNENYGLITLLPQKDGMWDKLVMDRAGAQLHGRSLAVLFSNIGVGWHQADKDQQNFLIENAIFSPYTTITESAINMGITTANGRLSIVTSWSDSSFINGRERVKLFSEELKKIILEATKEGRDQYFYKDAKASYFEKHTLAL